MKYIGIVTQSDVKNNYSNKGRFSVYFHHSRVFRGKIVKYYEVIEDTAPKPVTINRSNMIQYHNFFTGEYIS